MCDPSSTAPLAAPLRPVDGGVVVAVFCSPGAVRTAVIGLHGGALKVKVKAPAEGGKANVALLELLAATFGVAASALTLLSGPQSRNKRVLVRGVGVGEAVAALEANLDWAGP